MMISQNETHQQENVYLPPITDVFIIQHENALLFGSPDLDDNTGGIGKDLPWDD